MFLTLRQRYERKVLADRDPVTGQIRRPYKLILEIVALIAFLVIGGLVFLSIASQRAKIASLERERAEQMNIAGAALAEQVVQLCAGPKPPVQISNLCPRASEVATAEESLPSAQVVVVLPSISADPPVVATSDGVTVTAPVSPGTEVAVTGPRGVGVAQIQCLESGDWKFTYTDSTELLLPGPCRTGAPVTTTQAGVTSISTVTQTETQTGTVTETQAGSTVTETQVQTQTQTETQVQTQTQTETQTQTVTDTVTVTQPFP